MNAVMTDVMLPPTEELLETEEISFEPVYLEPSEVNFKNENDRLSLTMADGTYYPRVTLRRCFPFATNNLYITVMTPMTEKDRAIELGIITEVDKLEDQSRQAVSEELKMHYFVPVIKQISKIKEEYGFQYWTVVTDRGEKEFIVRDNIVSTSRQISPTRWLLIDINQARYELNDDEGLDKRSRTLMTRYLLL
jgi:hypothetical protein